MSHWYYASVSRFKTCTWCFWIWQSLASDWQNPPSFWLLRHQQREVNLNIYFRAELAGSFHLTLMGGVSNEMGWEAKPAEAGVSQQQLMSVLQQCVMTGSTSHGKRKKGWRGAISAWYLVEVAEPTKTEKLFFNTKLYSIKTETLKLKLKISIIKLKSMSFVTTAGTSSTGPFTETFTGPNWCPAPG